jgi:hypothetical protein
MTILETLESARKLISDPIKWTRGSLARDVSGSSVQPDSAEAVCWCLNGSILHFDPMFDSWHMLSVGTKSLCHWVFNHAEVLAAFDAAIAKCELAELRAPESEE